MKNLDAEMERTAREIREGREGNGLYEDFCCRARYIVSTGEYTISCCGKVLRHPDVEALYEQYLSLEMEVRQ